MTCPLPLHVLQRILPEPEHRGCSPYLSENKPFLIRIRPEPEHGSHITVPPESQLPHLIIIWPEAPQDAHKQSWQSNLPFPWQEEQGLNLDILHPSRRLQRRTPLNYHDALRNAT